MSAGRPGRLRVDVDRSVCIGSGMCAGTAPDVFELDEFNQSRPKLAEVDDREPVRDAAESCPVEAISLYDAESGEELFPGG